ncbi:hypothetical protein BG000_007095 [Podila horticola]|nr:hypothetical protein BG000_007095 [Podila horticola]
MSQQLYRREIFKRYVALFVSSGVARVVFGVEPDKLEKFYVNRIYNLSEPPWCLNFVAPHLFLDLPADLSAWDDRYDLKRSNESFDKFRHFTLEMLRTIKDGFRDEHCCVPKLGTLDILGCCGGATIQHGLIQDNIEPRSTCQSPISNSDNQTLWDVHL